MTTRNPNRSNSASPATSNSSPVQMTATTPASPQLGLQHGVPIGGLILGSPQFLDRGLRSQTLLPGCKIFAGVEILESGYREDYLWRCWRCIVGEFIGGECIEMIKL